MCFEEIRCWTNLLTWILFLSLCNVSSFDCYLILHLFLFFYFKCCFNIGSMNDVEGGICDIYCCRSVMLSFNAFSLSVIVFLGLLPIAGHSDVLCISWSLASSGSRCVSDDYWDWRAFLHWFECLTFVFYSWFWTCT